MIAGSQPRYGTMGYLKATMSARYPQVTAMAIWTAVSRWTMQNNPEGRPDYAVTEMLAASPRKAFGTNRYLPRFGEYSSKADDLRQQWWAQGCPGINAAARHTLHVINKYEANKYPCH